MSWSDSECIKPEGKNVQFITFSILYYLFGKCLSFARITAKLS